MDFLQGTHYLRRMFVPQPRFILTCLLLLGLGQTLFAGHNSGVNISYECIGGGDYLITVNVFRDCAEVLPSPANLNVFIYSGCDNLGFTSFPLISTEEVSQLCPSELANSTCNGGTEPGVELSVYQETVYLEPCLDWKIVVAEQNRTISVNLIDPGINRIHVEAFLNNTAGCNDSPELGVLNLPYVCVGSPLFYNLGFTEADGDSLAYALVPALTSTQADMPYVMDYTGTYSGAAPMADITIDLVTGQILLTPDMIGIFNVVVEVREYRDGVLVGIVLHDFLFLANPCPVPPPLPVPGSLTQVSGGGYPLGDLSVGICAGDDFCFELDVSSDDPTLSVDISSNIDALIPGATETLFGTNPATIQFCGTVPADFTEGSFVVSAFDNACSVYGQAFFVVDFSLREPFEVSDDQVICAGESVQLQAENDTIYTWTDLNGDLIVPGADFSCNPCADPVVSPDTTTSYIVTGLYADSGCPNIYTVTVTIPLNLEISETAATCLGGDGIIEITILTGSGNYAVIWDDIPTNDLLRENLDAGIYNVQILDLNYGCTRSESFTIEQLTEPVTDAGPDDVSCSLSYTLDATPSIGAPVWTGPAGVVFADAEDPYSTVTASAAGTYTLTWTEDAGFSCVSSDEVEITFYETPNLTLAAPDSICGLEVPLEATATNGDFSWMDNTDLIPADAGAESTVGAASGYGPQMIVATVTNGPCIAAESIEIHFVEQPIANAGTDMQVCTDSVEILALPTVGDGTWILPAGITLAGANSETANTAYANGYGAFNLIWEESNENFCVSSDTIEVRFTAQPDVVLGADTMLCGQEILLQIVNTPGDLTWILQDGYAGTTSDGLVNTIMGPYGIFTVEVEADNGYGCTDGDEVMVHFVEQPVLDTPLLENNCGFIIPLNGDPIAVMNYWEDLSGLAIGNPNAAVTTATAPGPGAYELMWIVSNETLCADTAIYAFTVFDQPESNAGADIEVCGLTATLDAVLSYGTFSWVDVPGITFGSTTSPESAIQAADYGSFQIVAQENDGTCTDSDTLQVTFVSSPVIQNASFVCAGYDALYELVFNVALGDTANYALSGVEGQWDDLSFYSDPIPSETWVEVVLSDAGDCGNDTLEGTLFCEVLSFSGEMNPDTIRVCGSDMAIADPANGVVLDENDSLRYILHTLPGEIIGDILNWNAAPEFGFTPSINYETVYYISAVVGNADGDTIDQNDPFISVTPGTPVVFFETPQASITGDYLVCPDEDVEIPVSFSGTLPQVVSYAFQGTENSFSIFGDPVVIQAADSGLYTLVANVSEYCTGVVTGSVQVSYFEEPDVDISLDESICDGDTAMLELLFSGNGPFSFDLYRNETLIDDYTAAEAISFEMLQEGLYQIVNLTDANCQKQDTTSAWLEVIPLPIALAGNDTVFCSGDTIRIGTPAEPAHAYNWQGSGNLINPNSAQPFITAIHQGNAPNNFLLAVTATQAGCTSQDTINVVLHALPQPQIIGPDTICSGQSVSVIGYGAQDYAWSPIQYFSNPYSQQSAFTTPVDTEISIEITSAIGCTAIMTRFIEVMPTPDAFFLASEMQGCAPLEVIYQAMDASEDFTYSWNTVTGNYESTTPYLAQNYTSDGKDQPHLTVTSAFGCQDTFSLPEPVEIYDTYAQFSFLPEAPDMTDSRVAFTNESPFNVSSFWTFDSLAISELRNTSYIFPDAISGNYKVCLEVTSPEGCEAQLCKTVEIADDFYMYVPNAFTPDGDGLNDLFAPVLSGIDLVEYRFWITNRRGHIVFDTTDPAEKWNGEAGDSGYYEGVDIYIWNLVAKPNFNVETKKYRGSVTLIR